MIIPICRLFILLCIVLMAVSTAESVFADGSTTTNGKSSQVQLHFKIIIPANLALEVKTATEDNMLASLPAIEISDAALSNARNKKIYITATANVAKHGRLNVSSNLLPIEKPPSPKKAEGQVLNQSFSLPYSLNGNYRLVLPPIDPDAGLSSDLPQTFVLCSP